MRVGFEIGFDLCGCFALLKEGRVIHIAQSRNLCTRINQYRNRLRKYKAGRRWEEVGQSSIVWDFDDIRLYPCPREELDSLERELVLHYKPETNRLHVRAVPEKKIDIAFLAKKAGIDLKELGL